LLRHRIDNPALSVYAYSLLEAVAAINGMAVASAAGSSIIGDRRLFMLRRVFAIVLAGIMMSTALGFTGVTVVKPVVCDGGSGLLIE
jgi:hypothetical protein